MTVKPKTIGAAVRQLRHERRSKEHSEVPQAMVESIRQSMKVEGYNLSAEEVREAEERSPEKGL